MRYLFPLFLVLSCLLTFLPGCEPKEDLVQTTGKLEFDRDTVLFDTVFTTIRTVTKRLWVYNRNSGAVKTDVSLLGTAGATYSLLINGDAGPSVSGITIRGNDSLLVLVRAVLGDNGQATAPKKFLVTDQVNFRTNGNEQDVKLVAYGQNAYFHRADYITANTTWATDKPHVIINSERTIGGVQAVFGVLVGQGFTLTIPKGARIYAHAGAFLQVDGQLLVGQDFVPGAGTTDTVKATNLNIVRFQGDRLEPFYSDIPGQWGGIVFTRTSTGNSIRYAEIKNAVFGALLYNPDNDASPRLTLSLDNTVIKNISGSQPSFANASISTGGGVVSYSADVTATNCLFTNCGEFAVLGAGGGTFDLNFCTFANYTPAFQRQSSALTFTNEKVRGGGTAFTSVTIRNSIVWGSFEDELFVKNYASYATLNIRNSVLRTKEYATNAAVVGTAGVNILADPLFVRPYNGGSSYDYNLQNSSAAAARPRAPFGSVPAKDILNLPRNQASPTLGAYEHK